jgi:hypothetical protein
LGKTNFNKLARKDKLAKKLDNEFLYYLRVNDGVEKIKTLFTSRLSKPLKIFKRS